MSASPSKQRRHQHNVGSQWYHKARFKMASRRTFLWRLLYVPFCVFLGGLIYFHVMLVDSMRFPQYYVIDGASVARQEFLQETVTKVSRFAREESRSNNRPLFNNASEWASVPRERRLRILLHGLNRMLGRESQEDQSLKSQLKLNQKRNYKNRTADRILIPHTTEKLKPKNDLTLEKNKAFDIDKRPNKSKQIVVPKVLPNLPTALPEVLPQAKELSPIRTLLSPKKQSTLFTVPFIRAWESNTVKQCGDRFTGLSGKLVILKDVIVHRHLAHADATGGEDIMSVKNRPESSESYTLKQGFFKLPCPEGILRSNFKPDTRANQGFMKSWYDALEFEGPILPEPRAKHTKTKNDNTNKANDKTPNPIQRISIRNDNNNKSLKAERKKSQTAGEKKQVDKDNKLKEHDQKINKNRYDPLRKKSKINRRLHSLEGQNIIKGLIKQNNQAIKDIHATEDQDGVKNVIDLAVGIKSKKGKDTKEINIKKDVVKDIKDTARIEPKPTSNHGAKNYTVHINNQFTLAVTRYEYANLYWALMDIYNAYLVLTYMKKTPRESQILFLDAKPWSHMDALWSALFGRVKRLSELPTETVKFKTMVWGFQRVHSPVLERKNLILNGPFRNAVFSSFNLSTTDTPRDERYGRNCSALLNTNRKLNVLFVWRHNYVAHPRNPSGIVSRKIANEDEILNASIRAFPQHSVRGLQLDLLPMREQINVISGTDVLIGMHGAAFAFTWFLPRGSGAVEMFPQNGGANWHMQHIAENNGVFYEKWKNNNPKNERLRSKSTVIPPEIVIGLIRDMAQTVCLGKKLPKPKPKPKPRQKSAPKPLLPPIENSPKNSPPKTPEIKDLMTKLTGNYTNPNHKMPNINKINKDVQTAVDALRKEVKRGRSNHIRIGDVDKNVAMSLMAPQKLRK